MLAHPLDGESMVARTEFVCLFLVQGLEWKIRSDFLGDQEGNQINRRSCGPKGTPEAMGIKGVNEASPVIILVCVRLIRKQDCAHGCVPMCTRVCFRGHHYSLAVPDNEVIIYLAL